MAFTEILQSQTLQGFPDHNSGKQEEEGCLGERSDALDLAMAVMMLLIGRLAGCVRRGFDGLRDCFGVLRRGINRLTGFA